MPEINALTRRKPVTVEIDLGDGDTLVVEYDRNRVTPNWVGVAQDRVNAQDVLATSTALAEVILQWDVTDDGAPFPPTAENIGRLSFSAQSALFAKIMEASVPSSEEGNDSSDTSASGRSEATFQTHPNGPSASVSPPSLTSPSPT